MSGRPRAPVAHVVLTGDELLEGRVRDTNGPYLTAALCGLGYSVAGLATVPDEERVIAATLSRILATRPDLVVVSGGLGTTHDDLTLAAVAAATGRPLERDAEAWSHVERRLRDLVARRRLPYDQIARQAEKLAWLPRGARCLPPAGMAPGADLTLEECRVIVLPGVPRELEEMWRAVADDLDIGGHTSVRLVRLHGVGETQVTLILEATPHAGVRVGITAGYGEVTVRLAADGPEAERRAAALVDALAAALPVYSTDGRTVDDMVVDALLTAGATAAVAESCTGGLVGARLTARPGSSAFFLGGVISYSDDMKQRLLDVPSELLVSHGAVSEPVAAAMAEGVRRRAGADYGIAVTGIAGPGGGSPAKPVGLVVIGAADAAGSAVSRHRFPGDRDAVRRQSTAAALHALLARCREGA